MFKKIYAPTTFPSCALKVPEVLNDVPKFPSIPPVPPHFIPCLYGDKIYIKNIYLKAKEELWKFKYFTMQKYNLQKSPLKETKILQSIITL